MSDTNADVTSIVVGFVMLGFIAMMWAVTSDDQMRPKCRVYLQEAVTTADSAAALSERPARLVRRDYAVTCRELLHEAKR